MVGEIAHEMLNVVLKILQMAIEYIMIMIFELMYDIRHFAIVGYRNKLAIHAKNV